MVDLTGNHDVKAICPRCFGNGFIRLQGVQYNCPQCDSQGWVMLPAYQCRENVEGGIEPRWMKTGETI
jgi:DnaJ-class molecular chaperone|tara:strand:+ start:1144 stop:1347 length:204 start_codon:yes stop_codon:yes gene_type:complete